MSLSENTIFVLAPAGLNPFSCLRACSVAGATGVWQVVPGTSKAALLEMFAQFDDAGLKDVAVAVQDSEGLALLLDATDNAVPCVIAPISVLVESKDLLSRMASGTKVWAEVTSASPELTGLESLLSGVVLKGHECAGAVSEQTTFVLLQQLRRLTDLPLVARGGISPATAAAVCVAGASGVMLDDEIMLLPEVGLTDPVLRRRIERFTGKETVQIEDPAGGRYLRAFAIDHSDTDAALTERAQADFEGVLAEAAPQSWADGPLYPGGQALALASGVQSRHRTLGRFIAALRRAWDTLPEQAAERRTLAEGNPLATANGTRYPVFQGPMTRVTDVSDFALRVADAGGLPFLAMSLLRGDTSTELLAATAAQLGDRKWGVGLLGFAGPKVLEPQFEAIERHRPDFAIVAGARIDQIDRLAKLGVAAFAHVSSASLLKHYLDEGVTRFIVEGRECGGHIGPMSSFVLWSLILETLEEHKVVQRTPAKVQLVFAGGIHDDLSAAMVATLAEPLAARGVQIGVLMGTAYLFTPEIVESGAIVADYQQVALNTDDTQSLWEGPGFASRCAITPIVTEFRTRRAEMVAQGAKVSEIRDALEEYSIGRLRVATKGLLREDGGLIQVDADRRHRDGMYMIGQVASLHKDLRSIAELHADVANGSADLLAKAFPAEATAPAQPAAPAPADIAIVGMATLLPGSDTLERYWRRILSGESAIEEIPGDRWSLDDYYNADPTERDRIYSMRGGFLPDISFDPLDYGIPPSSIPSVDTMQLLALELVKDALKDASLGGEQVFDRERMSVIFGFSGGIGETGAQYVTRSELTRLMGEVPEEFLSRLPEWTEDSFAGLLPNVAAGRVANRFDFGGTNQTVDAACASSLAALYSAILELESGRADTVVTGGVDTLQSPFGYLCFAKTTALSARGVCNTFDESADGIVISEGLASVVLKRLSDAERDGDRIYAVIKGIGASSDGRAKGLTAPLPKGQMRALRRAYAQAGFAPDKVQLFEAHGTGTAAGDKAELETVQGILADSDVSSRSVAIGSVKTLIGHTKAAAGVAGLIKVALGLHNKVLPPHALVKKPNAVFKNSETPLFLSQVPRPWIVAEGEPRRAGISAFGFGGTNFHVALEEYNGPSVAPQADAGCDIVPFAIAAPSAEALEKALTRLEVAMAKAPDAGLAELALECFAATGTHRVGFVVGSREDLRRCIADARRVMQGESCDGIYYSDAPTLADGKLAFLFSGQGAQYPDMHRQTALIAPQLMESLGRAQTLLASTPTFEKLGRSLARVIYPGDFFTPDERKAQMAALTATEVAQPALGAVEIGLARFLETLGLQPDMVAGHSYGEFAALCAAGTLSFDDLIRISEARGRAIVENADPAQPGAMIAVTADAETTRSVVGDLDGVTVANLNSPLQTVIAGSEAAIARAAEVLEKAELGFARVRVSQAFHSPLMAPAQAQFAKALAEASWHAPTVPVYSNRTAEPHPSDNIADAMIEHLVSSVDFVSEVRNMARDGAKVFVEVGPKSILADRIGEILQDTDHTSIALDSGNGDANALIAGLVQLFTLGAQVDLPVLLSRFASPKSRNLGEPGRHTWYLNGAYARRADEPKRDASAPKSVVMPVATQTQTQTPIQTPAPANFTNGAASTTDDEELEFMEITPGAFFTPGNGSARQATDPMASYHNMMTEFLRVQESVMRAYLSAGAITPGAQPAALAAPAPMPQVAAPVPVPTEAVLTPMSAPVAQAPAPVAPTPAPAPIAEPAPAPVAAPVAEAPAAPAVPAAPAAMGPDEILASFIEIVADKTGYPTDALDPDQALEADLGVDSIKRMEILAAIQKTLPDSLASAMRADMDKVSQLVTLREIVDFVTSSAGAEAPVAETASPFDLAGEAETTATAVLPRYIQVPFAEDASGVAWDLPKTVHVLVTPSRDGFHETVVAALAAKGVEAEVLPLADATPELFAGMAEQERPIALIHCAGRGLLDDAALADWHQTHEAGTKEVFRLLQAAQPVLQNGGRFLAVFAMGGLFGRDPDAPVPMPAEAGVVGLVKSLSLEWRECSLKVVDLDPAEDTTSQADHVVREISMLHGRREVGYPAGVRTILRTEPAATEPPLIDVDVPGPDWVVLASGGARGITAECLRTIAPSGARLVLMGRSARPDPEPEDMWGLDLVGLRGYFLNAARAAGEKPRPAEIERKVQTHLGVRDLNDNLRDFEAAGATVEYRAVDICDTKAVKALCDELLKAHGRIDLVVHGAGLIEDVQFEKKTRKSFDRVFDTKVDGAKCLVEAALNPKLKGICFFTSVAGRYGNPGQADYAAANETLNFYARKLSHDLPDVTVKAINWGPWDATTTGAGMVTDSTRAQFLSRGIGMCEAVPGREYFWREMFWSDPAQVETSGWVADGEAMESAVCDLPADPKEPTNETGLLLRKARRAGNALHWRFDMVSAPYTDDHRFDRQAVMPMAGMMQLFSEVPAAFGITDPVVELRNLRMLQGLTLKDGPLDVKIELGDETDDGRPARVYSTGAKSRLLYQADLVTQPTVPLGTATPTGIDNIAPWQGASIDWVYRRWLSHGPRFQTLEQIVGIDTDRIRTRVRPTDPASFVAQGRGQAWAFDPGLIDGLLQVLWVWTRVVHDIAGLPLGVASVKRFAADPALGPLWCELDNITLSNSLELVADARAFDANGALLYQFDGFRFQCSAALNRLGGGWPGGERTSLEEARKVAE